MRVDGSSILHADPEGVWRAITDPGVLAGVIPGCQQLTPLADNHFGLTVSMGVAAIKGTYSGEVRLYDLDEPRALTMRAAGAGAPGTIDTTVTVALTDVGDGTTQLDYDADAVVGGMIGGVGQRVLTSVARKTAGLFFASIDDVLTGKRPARGEVATAGLAGSELTGAIPGAVPVSDHPVEPPGGPVERPFGAFLATPAASAGPGPVTVFAAVAAGALAMAVGVLIGTRIARNRH